MLTLATLSVAAGLWVGDVIDWMTRPADGSAPGVLRELPHGYDFQPWEPPC